MSILPRILSCIALLIGIGVIIAGVIGYVIIPQVVADAIKAALPLPRPGSGTKYDDWVDNTNSKNPLYASYYVYNLTNADEVEFSGAIPNFVEVGPYTFIKSRVLRDVQWNENNGTVQFKTRGWFTFVPEKSKNRADGRQLNLSDVIVSVSLPLVGLRLRARAMCAAGDNSLWNALPMVAAATRQRMFEPRTVQQFVFGYNSTLLGALRQPAEVVVIRPTNDVFPTEYITGTGMGIEGWSNVDSTGWITMTAGQRKLPYWGSDEANKIGGFTTRIPTPLQNSFPYWADPLYRIIRFKRENEVKLYTLNLIRYRLDGSLADVNPAFYNQQRGLMPLPPALGTPIFLSRVRFYDADFTFINVTINGRKASNDLFDKDKHDVLMDVDALTGIPFRGSNRLQMNVFLSPIVCNNTRLGVAPNLPTTWFPFLWVDETAEASKETCDTFKEKVLRVLTFANTLGLAALIVGCFCVIAAVGSCFIGTGSGDSSNSDAKQTIDIVVAPAESEEMRETPATEETMVVSVVPQPMEVKEL